VAEGLTSVMRGAQGKDLYDGNKVGKDHVDVSMLQFADNTIVFL